MDSVETGHAGGDIPDSPTVCELSHDTSDDSDTLCKDEDKVKQFLTLSDRAPTVQRIVDEIKSSAQVKTMVEHASVFAGANHYALFFPEMWQDIHSKKIITAISASAGDEGTIITISLRPSAWTIDAAAVPRRIRG